jgi:hypothetical protein
VEGMGRGWEIDKMNEEWKKQDRPCPPCANCGEELYEKFWGNGGWAPTSKATDKTHSDRDCVASMRMQLIDMRNQRDAARAELARIKATEEQDE